MNRRDAIQALMGLPSAALVSKADVKAGDVIIIECPDYVPSGVKEEQRARLKKIWPSAKVCIFDGGTKFRILRGA